MGNEILASLKENLSLFIVIVIILAVGALAINSFRDSIQADIDTSSTSNESVTWTNNTYVALANGGGTDLTCTAVSNNSAWTTLIPAANWTCTTAGINVVQTSSVYASAVFVNYTYKQPNAAYNISSNGLTGALNASAQFGSIGTLMAVAALVGVVIGAFYLAKRY